MVVTVLKLKNHQIGSLYNGVRSAIELIGGLGISPGDKVIIKPNLCRVMPASSGATTDLRIVEVIVKTIVNEVGDCDIFVVESNNHTRNADTAFRKLGYTRLERYGVTLSNLSSEESSLISLPNGRFFRKLRVPRTLQHFDYFISVAKLKTHLFERITCILKNQFGCISYGEKSRFHPFISEVLYDLNQIYKPDLCVIDGLIAMEGLGPENGTPRWTNVIICGNDAVETDVVAAKIMGFNPKSIPHLNYAIRSSPEKARPTLTLGSQVESLNFRFIPQYRYLLSRVNFKLARTRAGSGQAILYWGLRKALAIMGRLTGV